MLFSGFLLSFPAMSSRTWYSSPRLSSDLYLTPLLPSGLILNSNLSSKLGYCLMVMMLPPLVLFSGDLLRWRTPSLTVHAVTFSMLLFLQGLNCERLSPARRLCHVALVSVFSFVSVAVGLASVQLMNESEVMADAVIISDFMVI